MTKKWTFAFFLYPRHMILIMLIYIGRPAIASRGHINPPLISKKKPTTRRNTPTKTLCTTPLYIWSMDIPDCESRTEVVCSSRPVVGYSTIQVILAIHHGAPLFPVLEDGTRAHEAIARHCLLRDCVRGVYTSTLLWASELVRAHSCHHLAPGPKRWAEAFDVHVLQVWIPHIQVPG
jgi:hypothetical protein